MFALAYFARDDLPDNVEFHLKYFCDAIDWLESQTYIEKHFLGLVEVSFGTNLTCNLPLLSDKIKIMVAINGVHYYNAQILHYIQRLSIFDLLHYER